MSSHKVGIFMITNLLRFYFSLVIIVNTFTVNAKVEYLIDSNRDYPVIISESDGNGTLLATYTYGVDPVPLSRHDLLTNDTLFFQYDGNFNLRSIADESGQIIVEYFYDAHGNLLKRKGLALENEQITFGGHKLDVETQNYYMRSRYYDPNIARFTQQDSFQGIQGRPQSLHKYTYAHNNPVNNTDPSGKSLFELTQTQKIGAILAATAATYTVGRTFIQYEKGGQFRNSGSLGNSSIQLINSTKNYINEITLFNTKHDSKRIESLISIADIHADKIGGSPPEDPNKSHWKKEVRAFLRKAKKIAEKRLKGKTQAAVLKRIQTVATKAGVTL